MHRFCDSVAHQPPRWTLLLHLTQHLCVKNVKSPDLRCHDSCMKGLKSSKSHLFDANAVACVQIGISLLKNCAAAGVVSMSSHV